LPNIYPLEDVSNVAKLIQAAIVDHPPLKLSEGGIIKEGYHKELDEIRALKTDSQTWLASYQTRLREETQIKTLKVGYTQAFGYYIEVSRGQSDKMPPNIPAPADACEYRTVYLSRAKRI
jgi:DNA mismatch repair protein MutS